MSGYVRSYELGDCTNGKESEMEIEIALFIPPISFQMYWSDDNDTCKTPVILSQGSSDILKKTWHLKMDKELSPVGKLAWVPNISLWGVSGLPFTSSH